MTLLTDVPSINEATASELREVGYPTAEAVAHANLLNLCDVADGVEPSMVLDAQAFLHDEYTNGWNTRPFAHQAPRNAHCSKCQKKFSIMQSTPIKIHRESCFDGSKRSDLL